MVQLAFFQRIVERADSGLKVNVPPGAKTIAEIDRANQHIYKALEKVPLAIFRIEKMCADCKTDYAPEFGWQMLLLHVKGGMYERGALYEAAGAMRAVKDLKKAHDSTTGQRGDDAVDLQLHIIYLKICVEAMEAELPRLGLDTTEQLKALARSAPCFPNATLCEEGAGNTLQLMDGIGK